MKMKGIIITALMLMASMGVNAQLRTGALSDSAKIAEYREKIGLDYSMPDYSVTSINEGKIGVRLANLLRFYEGVKNQNVYSRWIGIILEEQYEAFEHSYVEVKKQKLVKVYKSGSDISIIYKLWLDKSSANLKQVEIKYHFKDGVSESNTINDMFSNLSHYVQAKKLLNQ